MKDLINKITGHMIIESVVSILLGLILMFWPTTTTTAFIYLFGGYFAVLGVINIVSYVRSREATSNLIVGALELIVALIIFVFPSEVGGAIGLIMGIAIVLVGILNVTRAIDLNRMGISSWLVVLILNIIVVIAGFVVIFNPFSSVVTLAQLIGIVLIGRGIIDLFSTMVFSKNLKG